MKNLNLLPVSNDVRRAISNTAAAYAAHLHLRTDILEVGEDFITVRIEQTAKVTDQVFDAKALVDKAKEIFSHLPENSYQIRVRPLVFSGDGIQAVSAEWVKNQMKKFGLEQADLVRDLDIDRFAMSKLLSNDSGFTKALKAAFWYYFKSLNSKD